MARHPQRWPGDRAQEVHLALRSRTTIRVRRAGRMRQQRWFPAAALAVGLFAINVVARLVTRFLFDGDDTAEGRASIMMFALIGVVLAIYTFIVSQRRRPSEWLLPDLVFGAVGGMLLTILVGPFISGGQPFGGGAGNFFAQVWLYAG